MLLLSDMQGEPKNTFSVHHIVATNQGKIKSFRRNLQRVQENKHYIAVFMLLLNILSTN